MKLRTPCAACLASVLLWSPGCHPALPQVEPPPPPAVTVGRPVQREIADFEEFTGRTEAVETVEVRARVQGFLASVDFDDGQEVEQEALLYEVDPRTFIAELEQTQAEVERIEALVKRTASEAGRAEGRRKSGVMPEEEYQSKVAARDEARASLRTAKAKMEEARLQLSFTRISAPIGGKTGRTQVTVGNLVGYNEPTLLTTIVSLDPIYVSFDASERLSLEYRRRIIEQGIPGAQERKVPATMKVEDETGFPHEGVLDFVSNTYDPSTGTIQVRAVFKNPDRILSPGMFVRIRIPMGPPQNKLLITERAIGTDQQGKYVLVVNAQNEVEYRPVQLGILVDGQYVVEKGLEPAERVIINGLQRAAARLESHAPGNPASNDRGVSSILFR